MLFSVHDDDGRITMANKVYDPEGYDKLLREHGYDKFASCPVSPLRSPDHVMVRNGLHCVRPHMFVSVNKRTIKCGESDAAVFSDIPKGVEVTLSAGDLVIQTMGWTKSRLDFSMSTPGVYTLSFERWPYQKFVADIEVRS